MSCTIFTYHAADKPCRELTENLAPFHLHIQQDEHTRHRGSEQQRDAERHFRDVVRSDKEMERWRWTNLEVLRDAHRQKLRRSENER